MKKISKPRILIADDNSSDVELLTEILQKDYEITTACDGEEALFSVKNSLPDLILLDIMMPGINGFDSCRLLKDDEKTMSIPIVLVTALHEKEDRIRAIEAGADDFLSKPVDREILSAKLKSLLSVKQHYDNLLCASKDKSDFLIGDGLISKSIEEVLEVEHPLLKIHPCIEDIIKSHLEIIILKLLSNRAMCGYDLIKEIYSRYSVLISQGTVYPFLYSLRESGIIQVEPMKGNMRTKLYSVTEEGKHIIEKRFNEFIETEEYFLKSIRNMGQYV